MKPTLKLSDQGLWLRRERSTRAIALDMETGARALRKIMESQGWRWSHAGGGATHAPCSACGAPFIALADLDNRRRCRPCRAGDASSVTVIASLYKDGKAAASGIAENQRATGCPSSTQAPNGAMVAAWNWDTGTAHSVACVPSSKGIVRV